MNNEMKKIDCKSCREHLADLLLDESYAAKRPDIAAHMAACPECSVELAELQSTFALLDQWHAPEPSAFFDTKLKARLREAAASEPEGIWERMRSFLQFSTGRGLRPAMAGALALAMVASGGGFLISSYQRPVVAPSAAVNDLRILDNNAQALQQMDQLLDSGSDDNSDPPTT
jgi:anti-sigma factor RsiW